MVVSMSELFELTGSLTTEDTDAVFVIVVPFGVAGFTFTTSVNVAVASSANEATEQLTGPGFPLYTRNGCTPESHSGQPAEGVGTGDHVVSHAEERA